MNANKILIVDDEALIRQKLDKWLKSEGFATAHAASAAETLACVEKTNFSIILLDLKLDDMDGFDLLKLLHADYPDICIIVFTGYKNKYDPEIARRYGAFDFFGKPIDFNLLGQKLKLAMESFRRNREIILQQEEARQNFQFSNIIGKSAGLLQVFEQIEALAPTDETVLILGETGTGKELFANALHTHSNRAQNLLITLNCGSIPEHLAESELFGHEKGAFTDAHQRKIGRFERAHNSSIFLDEIGELNSAVQAKLLRVLEQKTFERVGGKEELSTDVRIIAATNRDLTKCIAENSFREDLFRRLERFVIQLPPLRERREDIPLIIENLIRQYNKKFNKSIKKIADDSLAKLMKYSFPGNVRELENLIINAMLFEKSTILHVDAMVEKIATDTGNSRRHNFEGKSYRQTRREFELRYFSYIIEKSGGHISQGARAAKMDRGHFRDKLRDLGLYANNKQDAIDQNKQEEEPIPD